MRRLLRSLAVAALGLGLGAASASDALGLAGTVEQMLRDALGQTPLPGGAASRVAVEVGQLDPRLRLAPCRRVETRLPPNARLWGRTRIGVKCVDGEKPWNVHLPVSVKVFAPALTAARALPAGTVLSADHLKMAEVDWAAEPALPFAGSAPLIGRSLVRPVLPGQALRADDVRQRQWFAAGDTVVVLARGAGFVVSGEAQALSNGVEGQPVRVRTEGGRVLSGVAVAERRVEVSL